MAGVPAGDKLPTYLAGAKPSAWLERALASDPLVELKEGTVGDLTGDPDVSVDALVVVDGSCPADPPGGDLVVVNPPAGTCLGATIGPALDHPAVTSWERSDPRLRFLTLDGLHVARANRVAPAATTQELVRAQGGTLVADASTPARAATIVGFDVGDSDWPLKASYVLFVRNIVEQARAHRAHGITGPAHAGEPMRVHVPSDARDVTATGPGGEKVEVSMRSGLAVLPNVNRAGIYEIGWKGARPGSLLVPANLVSAAESNLGGEQLAASTKGAASVSDGGPPVQAHTEWGYLFALAALALLVADVAYLTRKPRPLSSAAPKRPERAAPARRPA